MAELQICMLGTFQVCWDFVPVNAGGWRDPLAARLLKLLLLMRPAALSDGAAVRLLGGGVTTFGLTRAVAAVQNALEPGATLARDEDGRVSFQPGPRCWIDIDALRSHYDAGVRAASRGDMFPAILALQEADALYQGDLLAETQEPWVQLPRLQLRALYMEILERVAEGHAVLSRYQDAVGVCHKALAHDPLRESTYQRMMTYHEETISLWDRLTHGRDEEAESTTIAAAAGGAGIPVINS